MKVQSRSLFYSLIVLFWVAAAHAQIMPAEKMTQQLLFVENCGQITDQYGQFRPDIDYRVKAPGMTLFIGKGALHYQFAKTSHAPAELSKSALCRTAAKAADSSQTETYRLDMMLSGANPRACVVAEAPDQYYENYYTNLVQATAHSFGRITYKDIYPNIDWVLYIKEGKLEYDFVIRPGGDVRDIKINYQGATNILDSGKQITITTPFGKITEGNLYAYEQNSGKPVPASFTLRRDELTFSIPAGRMKRNTIVIDPTLVWGTYFGGNSYDAAFDVVRDSAGNVSIAGITGSTDNVATTGAYQTLLGGSTDIFLAKFSSSGSRLWATYCGGIGTEYMHGLCNDIFGNLYVAVYTSGAMPVTSGAFQPSYGGGMSDAYLAKFNSAGELRWATYYGGDSEDVATAVGCDDAGNVYLAGSTNSTTGIATTGCYQAGLAGSFDAFIARFDSAGSREWGTYFGGGGMDGPGYQIACDGWGHIYLAGKTNSATGIATAGAWQESLAGSDDAFLLKLRDDGQPVWCTYYGSDDQDAGNGVVIDGYGDMIMCGGTASPSGIATPGTHQSSYGGGVDAMLLKFDTSGSRKWATYYGGAGYDDAWKVAYSHGNIFIIGRTQSTENISSTGSYQATLASGLNAFLAAFNGSGVLNWATYFGGACWSVAYGIATDDTGDVYIAGQADSGSSNISTPGSYQAVCGGPADGYIAKFGAFPAGVTGTQQKVEELLLYPNPNNGTFTLQYDLYSPASATITIVNESGVVLYQCIEPLASHFEKNITLPAPSLGIYTLNVEVAGTTATKKFTVVK